MLLFRYAEGKEATVVVSAMLPSIYSRNIDFYLNIAIPGFNSCTARFQAIERTKRLQYDVSFYLKMKFQTVNVYIMLLINAISNFIR